jgi:hypothetical protein
LDLLSFNATWLEDEKFREDRNSAILLRVGKNLKPSWIAQYGLGENRKGSFVEVLE